MKVVSFVSSRLALAVLATILTVKFANAKEETALKKFLSNLKEKYDILDDRAQFATGAAIGFGGARTLTKSAVGVVKVCGAAFVATEFLNACGMLDDIPSFSDDQLEMIESVKNRALTYADDFRTSMRNTFNAEKMRTVMENERMGALGAATGAFVGFMV
jgi:hypothetical protein